MAKKKKQNNNTPRGPVKVEGPVVDPNSAEGLRMIEEIDAMHRGSGPMAPPASMAPTDGLASYMDLPTKEQADAVKADASAAADRAVAEVAKPGLTIEQRQQAARDAVKAGNNKREAASIAGEVGRPIDTGLPAGQDEKLPGEIWRAEGGSGARIVVMGGQFMLEANGVWSWVTQEQAAMVANLDKQDADVQNKRQTNKVREAELEAWLEKADGEERGYAIANQVILSGMAGELAGLPPDVQERLAPLYNDAALIAELSKLPPAKFRDAITTLQQMYNGGASLGEINGVSDRFRSQSQNNKRTKIAQAHSAYKDHLAVLGDDVQTWTDKLSALETEAMGYIAGKVGTEKPDGTGPMSVKDARDQAELIYGPQIARATTARSSALTDWKSAQQRSDSMATANAAQWTPEYGGSKDLDAIANPSIHTLGSSTWASKINGVGGEIWSIMDQVARDSGFPDGLGSKGFKEQLADPDEASMFVMESMRKARHMGWQTDETTPWVNGLAQHVLGSPSSEDISMLVNAAAKANAEANFHITQETMALQQQQQQQEQQAGPLLPQLLSSVGDLMPPSVLNALSSGVKFPEGTAEQAEVLFEIDTKGVAAGMSDEQIEAAKAEYLSLEEGGVTAEQAEPGVGMDVNLSTEVEEASMATGEDIEVLAEEGVGDRYIESLGRVMVSQMAMQLAGDGATDADAMREASRQAQTQWQLAMNVDGALDPSRSNEAWSQFVDNARRLSLEYGGQEADGKKRPNINREDIEKAIQLLEKYRHGKRERDTGYSSPYMKRYEIQQSNR